MIYLDNAATTFPKPECVVTAVTDFLNSCGGNPGRGGHYYSRLSGEKIFECREMLADFIGAENSDEIIFTKNATEALNLAIKGSVKYGDEIILSSMEHNSVLRSAISLEKLGVTVKIARADSNGLITSKDILPLITEKTRLVCIIHASNVVGTVNPIREICNAVHSRGVLTLVDAAQSAGIIDIDVKCSDMVAFAGHKALYGPFGTGALYIKKGLKLNTLIEGGTGSMSESALMPEITPDRYEAGTLNASGIAGLYKGIEFVKKEGAMEKEIELGKYLCEELSSIKGIKIIGTPSTGVVGVKCLGHDCVDIAARLDSEYGIAVRAGLHCAPMAHRTLGTVSEGLLRISAGFFNTKEDISLVASALNTLTH